MSSVIQNLLHKTLGDGARSTKFDAAFQFTTPDQPDPTGVTASVKTTSFPGKSHTPIHLKHRGRPIPIRGSVKYSQTWECTFYLTENHSLKNAFELWIEALDETMNYANVSETTGLDKLQESQNLNQFFTEIVIYQLSFSEEDKQSKYTLHNAFPINTTPVTVSYEGSSKVLEFTVTFAYTHYTHQVTKGGAGSFIDGLVDAVNGLAGSLASSIGNFVGAGLGDSLLVDLNSGAEKSITAITSNSMLTSLNSGGVSKNDMPSKVET